MSFVLITYFEWLRGLIKHKLKKKNGKNLLLRNCKGDEACTWHYGIHVHCMNEPLHKLCFLFQSDANLVSISFECVWYFCVLFFFCMCLCVCVCVCDLK